MSRHRYDEQLQFREARFLENPRVPLAVTAERSRIHVEGSDADAAAAAWDPTGAPLPPRGLAHGNAR